MYHWILVISPGIGPQLGIPSGHGMYHLLIGHSPGIVVSWEISGNGMYHWMLLISPGIGAQLEVPVDMESTTCIMTTVHLIWALQRMRLWTCMADLPVICYAGLLDSRVWRGCYPGQRDVFLGFRLPNRVTELRWASCKLTAVSSYPLFTWMINRDYWGIH
ncbi:unnamed protein product [Ambrosiozyma monospora]|uniref:Unnamed protein product n=1 Tax=Ambrosiozyma monospora TaxID=43982 RepID=A0A9W6T3H7_AMBMO|nr:unnamed protein product [Ambrosiozyma monospora]